MLEIEAVTLRRGARPLLDRISLSIAAGRLTAILGPNGAGKSTLIKAISGEWRPSEGRVLLGGEDIRHMSAARLAGLRAIVPQATSLSFPFTVLDVVMLGATVPGFGLDTDDEPALDAIGEVDLAGFEHRLYTELSGGEKQRVHIARALCQLNSSPAPADAARLLLLDEPTSSLDPAHQVMVLALLRQQAAIGWAVVVILHDLNLAAAWADEIVLMAQATILGRGAPAAVLTDRLLSQAYGCAIRTNATPEAGGVFVLPHHIAPLRADRGERVVLDGKRCIAP